MVAALEDHSNPRDCHDGRGRRNQRISELFRSLQRRSDAIISIDHDSVILFAIGQRKDLCYPLPKFWDSRQLCYAEYLRHCTRAVHTYVKTGKNISHGQDYS